MPNTLPTESMHFSQQTKTALILFQSKINSQNINGNLSESDAIALKSLYLYDNFTDSLQFPLSGNYLYKLYVPVFQNRSRQTIGTLFDKQGHKLLTFHARTRAQSLSSQNPTQRNDLSSNGATPSGLMECDLNSPESDTKSFGPYPINRAVLGLKGNAHFLIRNNAQTSIRKGILVHTGQWQGWKAPMPMPNSHGCIHVWPNEIKAIWQTLVKLGVQVRNNTDGALPYPYQPQGLLSVSCQDC